MTFSIRELKLIAFDMIAEGWDADELAGSFCTISALIKKLESIEKEELQQAKEKLAAKAEEKKPAEKKPAEKKETSSGKLFSGYGARTKQLTFEKLREARERNVTAKQISEASEGAVTEEEIYAAINAEKLPIATWDAIGAALEKMEGEHE